MRGILSVCWMSISLLLHRWSFNVALAHPFQESSQASNSDGSETDMQHPNTPQARARPPMMGELKHSISVWIYGLGNPLWTSLLTGAGEEDHIRMGKPLWPNHYSPHVEIMIYWIYCCGFNEWIRNRRFPSQRSIKILLFPFLHTNAVVPLGGIPL